MSSSIDALVAERLDISEERARKLLRTMIKELRDRVREEGVRLPELGTFHEENGTLNFSPSPSLRRLVNRQYEGLQAEDLSSAAGYDQEEDKSIPTLLDQAEEPSQSAPPSEPEPSAAEESAAEEQDYPVVGEGSEADREEESTVGPEPIHEMDEPEREPARTAEPERESPSSSSRNVEPEEDAEPAGTSGFRPPDSFQLIAGLLLLALLVGMGWFVFDQTNVLSSLTGPDSPPTAVKQNGSSPPSAPSSPDTARGASSASNEQTNRYPGVDPSDQAQEKSNATAVQGGGPQSRHEIDPDAGGWTIVVASMANRKSASPVVSRYQNRFADTSLPVDIVVGTVNDEVRYRVALGQYDSRKSVLRALKKYESMLPAGAWPLQLG